MIERKRVVFSLLLSMVLTGSLLPSARGQSAQNPASFAPAITDLQRLFQKPPDDSRIMMRWWWFGPAVTKAQLEREMRLMKEGGIGGFEVQPVYPVALDDEAAGIKTLPLLSDEFIEMLRFTSEKARELGLRMDLTLGSGWPFGGPTVSIAQAAGRLRCDRVKITPELKRVPLPDAGNGEKFIAAFVARKEGQGIVPGSLREITEFKDGAVILPAGLDASYEVLFFTSSRTGMQVKRPAIGGEGFVLDHLDRKAIDNYLSKVGDRLMTAFGSNPPYAIFCDSLEVYDNDWTGDLLDEFRKRRGYDLKPHLPALVADIGPTTAAIRRDYGKTLTELLNEEFLAPMRDWTKRNKVLFRIQDYGVPAATIASNAYADLPEGEGSQWKALRASRWAASASHIYGRPVTSSETWTWLNSPVFRATPLDMKAEADRHFLQGINQLIGHGWPYTAPGADYPGWRFYAAGVFNEKNPWWIVMPDLSLYLQRLSFLLRQGQPANDVAIYLPNDDAWGHFTSRNVHMIEILRERLGPNLIPAILEAGYNFDFFDEDSFNQVGRIEKESLVLGQNKYRVVILPSVTRMSVGMLKRLEEFVAGGGIVIATRSTPSGAPGLQATDAENAQIAEMSNRLFKSSSPRVRFVENETAQLASTLGSLLKPDVSLATAAPDIGFVHRRTQDAHIYFVANTGNVSRSVSAQFRVSGLTAHWWDPMSGGISPVELDAGSQGTTIIKLDLEPYGSRVLVFSGGARNQVAVKQPDEVPNLLDLSSDWHVSFGSNGDSTLMGRLRSWTDDEATRYFSGVATYEKSVTVPQNFLGKGLSVKLDFGAGQTIPERAARAGMHAALEGPVREAAVVYVNGSRAGSVWCPPYSVDVTRLLRGGENRIRIMVGNLAINHMAGHALPDYRLLNLRYGTRFEPQEMERVRAEPAGLLGPIRLIAEK